VTDEGGSVLQRLACFQGRRDEVPNQELARDLVTREDRDGIRELAAGLRHADQHVRSDCLKTLYEAGHLEPSLIADFVDDFLWLLRDRNNRMVWGAMIALATVAPVMPDALYVHREEIQAAMAGGSVITADNAVKALAATAAANDAYRADLLRDLLDHLARCRPKDVPQHAEAIVQSVDAGHADAFIALLEGRMASMSASQAGRVRRVMRQAEARKKPT
jgi:hypothetical protein